MMDAELEKYIHDILVDTVTRTIQRMKKEDTHRPFHQALLSDEIIKASRFERSFSTSFGQKAVEKISAEVLKANGAINVETQKQVYINLSESKISAIHNHIAQLRNSKESGRKPAWDTDFKEILEVMDVLAEKKERVISDLYWEKDGMKNYASIKTVKPNIDQTAQAKIDLLLLKANDPTSNVYYALYYNPFGEKRSDYNPGASSGIFNFHTDESVIIGKEYWDLLGGEGFYEELLAVFAQVGIKTKQLILS